MSCIAIIESNIYHWIKYHYVKRLKARWRLKKVGVLNRDISEVIASMGHNDMLVIADAGLPIPDGVQRIDLALRKDVPGFLITVETILQELHVEKAYIARETFSISPYIGKQLRELLEGVQIIDVNHDELKQLSSHAKAVVRTGEFTPYANVILVSGVIF